jgi:hypothetical protein
LHVTALVIGRQGLLERLGARRAAPDTAGRRLHDHDTVAWNRVVRVEPGLVTVRDDGEDPA